MSERAGKALEGAMKLAAADYRRAGRADVFFRETPTVNPHGTTIYTAPSGVDFHGGVFGEGAPTYFTADAKECHAASLPLDNIADHQLETLRRNRAGLSGLVVAFLPAWEVFWIPIVEFDQFLTAKWRESLSRDWCRAFGKLLPVDVRPSLRQKGRFVRHVRFLDGAKHPEADHATARVNAERLTRVVRESPKKSPETLELFETKASIGGAVHPYEEGQPGCLRGGAVGQKSAPFDPFTRAHLERFGRRNQIKPKNWGNK
jgi:penicillin-binding protein-related factor A (putative recombinase)